MKNINVLQCYILVCHHQYHIRTSVSGNIQNNAKIRHKLGYLPQTGVRSRKSCFRTLEIKITPPPPKYLPMPLPMIEEKYKTKWKQKLYLTRS